MPQNMLLNKIKPDHKMLSNCAAIWNVIKKLLTADQQKYVLMVKKNQIGQYIDEDQLFVHMGGTVSLLCHVLCILCTLYFLGSFTK